MRDLRCRGARRGRRDHRRLDRSPRRAAGIRVFATGGLGGVHRGARETWDESADLTTLSRTPVLSSAQASSRSSTSRPRSNGSRRSTSACSATAPTASPASTARLRLPARHWSVRPREVAAVLRARRELGTDALRPRARQSGRPGRRARPRRARRGPRRGPLAAAAAGRDRQGRHAVPARLFPPARRTARRCAPMSRSCWRTRAWQARWQCSWRHRRRSTPPSAAVEHGPARAARGVPGRCDGRRARPAVRPPGDRFGPPGSGRATRRRIGGQHCKLARARRVPSTVIGRVGPNVLGSWSLARLAERWPPG